MFRLGCSRVKEVEESREDGRREWDRERRLGSMGV